MFTVPLFILLLENVLLTTQTAEDIFSDNIAIGSDVVTERDTTIDNVIPVQGNVLFNGQANARGTVRIVASSGGPLYHQTQSHTIQPANTRNSVFNPYNPRAYSLNSPSSLLYGLNPSLFFTYPKYIPFLESRYQKFDNPKLILPESIRTKLSNVKILPKVVIPNIAKETETVCPMVQPITSCNCCPKMVGASPIRINLGPFQFRLITSNVPVQINTGINIVSSSPNSIVIKPTLEVIYPGLSGQSPGSITPPNIFNPYYPPAVLAPAQYKLPPLAEESKPNNINPVNNFKPEEFPVKNLPFAGVIPVSGKFKIFAKF